MREMKITGVDYRRAYRTETADSFLARFWRGGRYFVWIVPLFFLPFAVGQIGTPHLLLSYEYYQRGGEPFYTHCAYFGLHSRQVRPGDGRCPLIKMIAE